MVLRLKPMGKPTNLEKTKVLDRTRALYGPRTQAYGVTKYLRINKGFGKNQGIVWSLDLSLWGNQLLKRKNKGFGQNQGIIWSSDSSLWGNQFLLLLISCYYNFWTQPGHCMVPGLCPIEGLPMNNWVNP